MKQAKTTKQPLEDSKEGLHTQPDKIKLWVTGSGKRTDQPENELLLRTDDATLHFKRDSEFGKLAHALVDSYNERKALLNENAKLLGLLKRFYKEARYADTTQDYFNSHWKQICEDFNINQ